MTARTLLAIAMLTNLMSLVAQDARAYYSPPMGRFLSRDPIGYEGSEWDLYEYVESSPTDFLDPSGEQYVGREKPDEEGDHIEVDAKRHCWDPDDWKKKCVDKGQLPPGHDPSDFPEDYPGLPPGFNKPQPIWWGDEIDRGEAALWDQMPGADDIDDEKGDCVCVSPYLHMSRMRPTGDKGQYPEPGSPKVPCKVGEYVIIRYPGVCKEKDDKRCEFPWDPKCTKKTCAEYVIYRCKSSKSGQTSWGNAPPRRGEEGRPRASAHK